MREAMSVSGNISAGGDIRGTVSGPAPIRGSTGGMKVLHTDSYAIAVANGFVGTVDEWLESLKGPKGDPGISPVVAVEDIDGGHRVTITDKDGEKTFDVMDGEDGAVTEEQIASAVEDYMAEHPVEVTDIVKTVNGIAPDENGNVEILVSGGNADQGGGMSTTAKNLLITILRNAVYSTDQSANITALENALASGGGEEPDIPDVPDEPDVPVVNTYTITAELVNVTSSNFATSVNENASYTATLTAYDGYNLDSVVVLMGGVDVTADVYADGVISIPSVTGNVEIIASAVVIEDPSAELVTDGLLAYFDFRTATYNNSGSGGSTTIAATQGEGQLFTWRAGMVTIQDGRGMHIGRNFLYSQAGNTKETDIGSPMTLVMLTYGHVMAHGFYPTNIDPWWEFVPRYNNTNGGTAYAENRAGVNMDNIADYNFCVYRVDGSTLTEIMDTSVTTYNGGDIDGFASWLTKVTIGATNRSDDGSYITAAAIYNRALSDVEIEEMRAFLNTLEVA